MILDFGAAIQPRRMHDLSLTYAGPSQRGEMGRRIREHDWAATPLGPIARWPQSLRTAAEMVLAMPSPATILWGPTHVQIYNDAYVAIAGDRHPELLGRSVAEGWPDAYNAVIAPLLDNARVGRALRLTDFFVPHEGPDSRVEERLFDIDWSPIYDESGAVAGVLQTLVETTDRFRAQTAMRESEARNRLLIESWTQATWESDANGAVTADSPSWRAYTGQTLDEWLGYGWLDAIHPDDRAHAEQQWREAVAAHRVVDAEFRLRAPNGGWRWTNVRAAPLLGAGGNIEKWAGINIDIDARKRSEEARARAEDALREGEARYRALFESMDEAYAVVEVLKDAAGEWADFRFLEVNPAFMVHTNMPYPVGQTAKELLGAPNPRWTELYGQALNTGETLRVEESEAALGITFDLNIFALDRTRNRVAVLFTNISERKQAEAALRTSEARFRALATAGGNSIYRMSADWRLMYQLDSTTLANTAAPIEDWVDKYIPEEDLPRVREAIEAAVRSKSLFELEHRVRQADGRIGWVLSRAVPLLDAAGEISEWFGAGSDVTERRKAIEQLRAREADLARVQRIGGVGGLDIDVAGGMTSQRSPEYLRLHGLPAETSGETHADWSARVHPDDVEGAEQKLFAALGGDSPSYEAEYRIVRPSDGAVRWIEARADIERDDQGKPVRLVGAHVDVTEQKRVQEALRESEERLRQFGEASQDILWIRDIETLEWTYLTTAFEQIYGLGREEALKGDNFRSWLELIVPEDRKHVRFNIERVRAGEHVTFEYRVRRPLDGEIRWLRNTDFPIPDEHGRIASLGGIGQDVTSIKAAEEKLRASEERLRSAAEVAKFALWDWNMISGEIAWSDEHFRMNGYAVGEVTPSYEAWALRLHPDDRKETEAALMRARDDQTEYGHEFRTLHPDGSIHWLEARGRFFYDEAGQPVRMVGAMLETTERRDWEERQKVLVAELQHRTRNLMGVVRAIADRTALASIDLKDFRGRFRERLEALSRVQGLLSRLNDYDRVTFDELIRTELSALGSCSDSVTLEGPEGVRLRSSTVQTLALALHELATNAVKYGALGRPSARLAITWSLDSSSDGGKPWLHIDWRESGVEMPPLGAAPRGTGQGRELIEQALPYQLGARTTYTLGPDGVHCTIGIPVSATEEDATVNG